MIVKVTFGYDSYFAEMTKEEAATLASILLAHNWFVVLGGNAKAREVAIERPLSPASLGATEEADDEQA